MNSLAFIPALCLSCLATPSTSFAQFGTGGSSAVTGPNGSDSCATPTPHSGPVAFFFDNTAATIGTQGQSEAACNFAGQTGITNDVWFSWAAFATGTATLRMCGLTAIDSKLAVYEGTGCPAAPAIACNDDFCGLQTEVSFPVVAGNTYTFQVGNHPGATGGTGQCAVDLVITPPTGCYLDNGDSESSVGPSSGGDLVWLNKFGAVGNTTTLPSVSAAYGTPNAPGSGLDGLPVTLAIWDDPNDDGNPNDLVLLATVGSTIASADTDTLVPGSFASPVVVQGVYFVGVAMTHQPMQFPAALDQDQTSMGRSWVAAGPAGSVNLANLSAAQIPPVDVDNIGFPGVWLVRADCSVTSVATFCEGSVALCPCGNGGAAGNGCANSLFAGGAHLAASGTPNLSADSFVLLGTGMPNSSALYFQGTTQVGGGTGAAFGDGLRCAGGSIVRLGTKLNVANQSSYPAAGDPSISVRGAVPAAGAGRTYQVWYRNAAAFCQPATFNLTNGLQVTWGA